MSIKQLRAAWNDVQSSAERVACAFSPCIALLNAAMFVFTFSHLLGTFEVYHDQPIQLGAHAAYTVWLILVAMVSNYVATGVSSG
jgi:hypothetical protein